MYFQSKRFYNSVKKEKSVFTKYKADIHCSLKSSQWEVLGTLYHNNSLLMGNVTSYIVNCHCTVMLHNLEEEVYRKEDS